MNNRLESILQKLTSFPHRGAGTKIEKEVVSFLKETIKEIGGTPYLDPFKSPKSYIYPTIYLLTLISIGLILIPIANGVSAILIIISIIMIILYYDWRKNPIEALPPKIKTQNIIGKKAKEKDKDKIIIITAHYDSAPISYFYRPEKLKSFYPSFLANIIIIATSGILPFIYNIYPQIVIWLRIPFILYFVVLSILVSIDFIRYGYSNGAGDNASGVAIAISLAEKLWKMEFKNFSIWLLLTGAEEVGMKGAYNFIKNHKETLKNKEIYVVNIDNVSFDSVNIVKKTGMITPVIYNNQLIKHAESIIEDDIKFITWKTADFDSLYFERNKIPSITFVSLGKDGYPKFLHRPEDTIENVDLKIVERGRDFIEKFILSFIEKNEDN